MPVRLNGETYYQTTEACRRAGTSRNTFLRWVKEGSFADVKHRDRRGWRLFTEDDLARLKAEVNQVN
jgi:predicted site-specific integrase-resolvase